MNSTFRIFLLASLVFLLHCAEPEPLTEVPQWTTHEIILTSTNTYENPYTDVQVLGIFKNAAGDSLIRPGFWDGDNTWKIRFSPPDSDQIWSWQSVASKSDDSGLNGQLGKIRSIAYQGDNHLIQHGLLRMSPGKRSVVHADGAPFLLVGDTPWALPFRATQAHATEYARDRQAKGFNAALLMTVQPDMEAEGPDARDTPLGFAKGFADLSEGHINQLNPAYFQMLDSLTGILLDHEIVPVYQPVFHGFGWKGKKVLGNYIDPAEYVRYCRYLLARYGSQPACWLLAGDNGGRDPGVKESGEMMEQLDTYQQPTGLHYNPCDDYIAEWAVDNPLKHCEHYNKRFQAEPWLDFQWAQTGHSDEHLYHKVERMYENVPIKASANGEPTYEGMNDGKNGLGWWQGEEAWMQFLSGGTMGVVYGAGGLWQWKVTADEQGWTAWAGQAMSWREAMKQEGSRYVGFVSKALGGYPTTDLKKRPDLSDQPLLAHAGRFYVAYLNEGGKISISGVPAGLPLRWFDPKNGTFEAEMTTDGNESFEAPNGNPWVLLIGERMER